MQVRSSMRLVILVSVFILQFLVLVIFINNMSSMSKELSGLRSEQIEQQSIEANNLNERTKEIKSDLNYEAEEYGLKRIHTTDYVDYVDVLNDQALVDLEPEVTSNPDTSMISR